MRAGPIQQFPWAEAAGEEPAETGARVVFQLPKLGCQMKSNKLTYAAYPKFPDGPLRQHRFGEHLQDEVPIVEGILVCWPVMVTLYLDQHRVKGSLETDSSMNLDFPSLEGLPEE